MKPLGAFLRCTGLSDPEEALAAVKSIGLDTIQVSKLDDSFYTPEGARRFGAMMDAAGVSATSVVIVFDGESYRDWKAVEDTVGFRPAALLEARLAYSRTCVDFAEGLGVGVVTVHMGLLPDDPSDPVYVRLLSSVRELAAYAEGHGITLSLETGQETGEQLARFLDRIPDHDVGVNFDLANMVLYRMDDPTSALKRVIDRVTSVHVKDGLPPDRPGALGRETRLGEGRARVKECLRILHESEFGGPLIIENYTWRELGTEPLDELRRAKEFVETALTEIGAG